jgi:hypothetical protein
VLTPVEKRIKTSNCATNVDREDEIFECDITDHLGRMKDLLKAWTNEDITIAHAKTKYRSILQKALGTVGTARASNQKKVGYSAISRCLEKGGSWEPGKGCVPYKGSPILDNE